MALKKRTTERVFHMKTPAAAVAAIWRAPVACRVTAIRGYRVAGTGAVVRALKGATTLVAADLSLTGADAWMSATLAANATTLKMAAGDTLKAEIVSVAGAPTDVTIQVEIEIDANV